MTLQWKTYGGVDGLIWGMYALTGSRVYEIVPEDGIIPVPEDGRLLLRVRDRAEPVDVPIDDLWVTLGYYHNPDFAMIHADYHEEKAA